jgi:ATP-dependent DNA helicase RecG
MKKISDQELESLLDDCESDLVERKQSFKSDVPKKARQAVCAFSNDLRNHNKPGILFIGAKDDGTPSNEPITDELLRTLADMKTDGNILASPTLSVEKRILKGAEMAIVIVMPSDMPPVRYEGRIWIRTGPHRAIANEQEERILIEKRRHKNLPFDLYPFPPAKLSDLSRLIFENEYLPAAFANDVLEANGRSYEERLAVCKMIVSPEETTPTILGLLAIGKSTQDFLAGAYIQFLRIDGTELADPVIDEEKIGGALVDMLHRIEKKLAAHNRIAFDVTSMPTHIKTSSYPAAAVHQIIYNAVLHRTYEGVNAPVHVYWFNDRIEISSPGGPYGNVTEKNFGKPGIVGYRNPNIGDVLKTFGFVQAFGRGIAIVRKELEKNGNLPPEFEVDQSRVLCTIRKKE